MLGDPQQFKCVQESFHIVCWGELREQTDSLLVGVWEVAMQRRGSGSLLHQLLGGILETYSQFLDHLLLQAGLQLVL